jgi:arginyl-tRNA synthetase
VKFQIVEDLTAELKGAFNVDDVAVAWELCPADQDGEITINCFRFAKALRANPMVVAEKTRDFLAAHAEVEKVEAVKAFVNATLKSGPLFRDTVANGGLLADARLPESERRKVLVEYSAPNTNKPQHLGHVRNNTLGASITALLGAVGHEAVPVNLVNDRGIAICKSMLAYERFGEGCTPESVGKKGDHLIGDFYVAFDKAYREQLEALQADNPELADKKADELFLQTEIGRAAHDMLIKWEAGDPGVRALWEKLNSWVLAGFDETYRRMGVNFAHTYYERWFFVAMAPACTSRRTSARLF